VARLLHASYSVSMCNRFHTYDFHMRMHKVLVLLCTRCVYVCFMGGIMVHNAMCFMLLGFARKVSRHAKTLELLL